MYTFVYIHEGMKFVDCYESFVGNLLREVSPFNRLKSKHTLGLYQK